MGICSKLQGYAKQILLNLATFRLFHSCFWSSVCESVEQPKVILTKGFSLSLQISQQGKTTEKGPFDRRVADIEHLSLWGIGDPPRAHVIYHILTCCLVSTIGQLVLKERRTDVRKLYYKYKKWHFDHSH